MTIAICLNCGKVKFGAWTPCPECGHQPETLEERAKRFMLSDHFFDQQELEQFAFRIKLGEPWFFDEEATREVMEGLADARECCRRCDTELKLVVFAAIVYANREVTYSDKNVVPQMLRADSGKFERCRAMQRVLATR